MAKKKTKQKLFKHPLFIAATAFVILFVIFLNLTPSKKYLSAEKPLPTPIMLKTTKDSSNWVTYKNTKIGFEIKSPEGVKVVPNKEPSGGPPSDDDPWVNFTDDEDHENRDYIRLGDYKLSIYPSDFAFEDLSKRHISDDGTIMQDWSKFYTPYSTSKRTLLDVNGLKIIKLVSIENENVNNLSSEYYSHSGPPEYHIQYEFIGNNYWFIFGEAGSTILSNQVDKGKLMERQMEEILSTFKFTKSNTAFCGGIMGKSCPEGYTCMLEGDYPDAGGTCVK